jgi:hypothetical protein
MVSLLKMLLHRYFLSFEYNFILQLYA